jgi:hypothetical protein
MPPGFLTDVCPLGTIILLELSKKFGPIQSYCCSPIADNFHITLKQASTRRGGKMRSIKFIVQGILIFLLFSVAAGSLYAYDSVITGKSNPEYDVKAVQDAVDKGGTVLLKGTFNFGKKGRVNIKNDIEIMGERDSNGRPLTKIMGGFWTFHSPLPSTELPLPGPGPKMKVKHIHFDGAIWTPMHFAYTSGAEISGNKITNVQPFAVPVKWPGGDKLLVNAGVLLGSRFAHREKILPGAATGHLVFNNNQVDLKCKNPEITMGQGAFYLWTWGATIEIKGNTIRNVARNSIESLDNYLDEEGRGSVLIAENNIVTPKVGIPFPSPSTPNGIVVGWFLDPSGGSDPTRNSKITVVRNFVQTNGDSSAGVISLGDGVAVLGNRIEIKGGSKSSGITQIGSNGFIARNKIDGTGAFALRALPWKEVKATGNTFAWNDVSEFRASAAGFLCLGNKNMLVGTNCKVVDRGKGNMMLTKY